MVSIVKTFIFNTRKSRMKMFFLITAFLTAFLLTLTLPKISSCEKSLACDVENSSLNIARTIVVPDNFERIQDAINNASDGDTVLVEPNIYDENVVVNKSIHLLGEDQKNTIMNGHGSDVITIVANNAVVSGFTIQNGNPFKCGIRIHKANDNVICNNIIRGNFIGVKLGDQSQETTGNVVRNNTITENRYGVFLAHSKHSVIDGNIIFNNKWNGVEIDWGEENIICGNTIFNNTAYGLEIPVSTPSYRNVIYHNNFVNNTKGCTSSSYENSWDDGYPNGGNFWNDYAGVDFNNGPNQNLQGRDGVGDTPYTVDQYMKDKYPLMGQISVFNANKANVPYCVSTVSNSTISHFSYSSINCKIKFQVNGANGTLGFCRINIPHALMTEPYNITVDGCKPIFVNYELFDNSTHRWMYFIYQHSTREVVIVPEFPIVVLPFFVVFIVVTFAKVFSVNSE